MQDFPESQVFFDLKQNFLQAIERNDTTALEQLICQPTFQNKESITLLLSAIEQPYTPFRNALLYLSKKDPHIFSVPRAKHWFNLAISHEDKELLGKMVDINRDLVPKKLDLDHLLKNLSSNQLPSLYFFVDYAIENDIALYQEMLQLHPTIANHPKIDKLLPKLFAPEHLKTLQDLIHTNPKLVRTSGASECLFIAFKQKNFNTVQFLLQCYPDLIYSQQGNSLLLEAENNQLSEIHFLTHAKKQSKFLSLSKDAQAEWLQVRDQLFQAIDDDDISKVIHLISVCSFKGIDMDQKNSLGQSPFAYSIAKGHFRIAQKLINGGCDINSPDALGDTPMHYIVNYSGDNLRGYDELVNHLLKSNPDLKTVSPRYGSIFSYILQSGKKKLLQDILNSPIDPTREELKEALFSITRSRILSEHETEYTSTVTWNSLSRQQTEACLSKLKYLYLKQYQQKNHANAELKNAKSLINITDSFGRTLLANSIIYGNLHAMVFWLRENSDILLPDKDGVRPIDHLCTSKLIKDEEISRFIYEQTFDKIMNKPFLSIVLQPFYSTKTVAKEKVLEGLLERAVSSEKFKLARWLYEDGARPLKQNNHVFTKAFKRLMHSFLDPSADENILCRHTRELIQYGANPNSALKGASPLRYAIQGDHFALALDLIEHSDHRSISNGRGLYMLDFMATHVPMPFAPMHTISPLNQKPIHYRQLIDKLLKQEFGQFDIPFPIVHQRSLYPIIQKAIEAKNIPFLCTLIQFGFNFQRSPLQSEFEKLLTNNDSLPLMSAILENRYHYSMRTHTASTSTEKETLSNESSQKSAWISDLYIDAISHGKWSIASHLKSYAVKNQDTLLLDRTDKFGRNTILHLILQRNYAEACEYLENKATVHHFTKADIFDENVFHYLSRQNIQENLQSLPTTHYIRLSQLHMNHVDAGIFLSKCITHIKKLGESNQAAADMLTPDKLKQYLEVSIHAENLGACHRWIVSGGLDGFYTQLKDIFQDPKNTDFATSKEHYSDYLTIQKLQALAAQRGDIFILNQLNNKGFPQDLKDIRLLTTDETPLFHAIKNENFKTALWLIENGSDANTKDAFGRNPLSVLSTLPHIESRIFQRDTSVEGSARNYFELLHKLAKKTTDLSTTNALVFPYIKEAIRAENFDTARIFIHLHPLELKEPQATNTEEMSIPEKFPYLFSNPHTLPASSILTQDIMNLELSFLDGYPDYILKPPYGNAPFMNACAMSSSFEINRLLTFGANINSQQADGKTGLMFAAAYSTPDILNQLVQNDANVHLQDACQKTALDYAIEHHKLENAAFLARQSENISILPKNRHALLKKLKASDFAFYQANKRYFKSYLSCSPSASEALLNRPLKQSNTPDSNGHSFNTRACKQNHRFHHDRRPLHIWAGFSNPSMQKTAALTSLPKKTTSKSPHIRFSI